jgi:hypothetical protein
VGADNNNARSAAVAHMQDTWDNLPRYAIRGMQAFSDVSTGQQIDEAIKFGFGSAFSLGACKAAGATGSVAYGGVKATAGLHRGPENSLEIICPVLAVWLTQRRRQLEQSLSRRVLNGDLWLKNRNAHLRNLGPFE